MKKICCFFNTPSIYRETIYSLIDKEYNCDWFFGDYDNKVKRFDTDILKHVEFLHVGNAGSRIYWTHGLPKLIANRSYNHYLMFGPTWDIYFWIAIILKIIFFRKKKIYLWVHGWYGKESRFEQILKIFMYKSVEGVFCYGDRARQCLLNLGFEKNKIFAIHNSLSYYEQLEIRKTLSATSIYKEHFNNNSFNLIFIGRLTKVKQLDLILEALVLLRNKSINMNLTFVGDGPMKEELIEYTKINNIQEHVWFYGSSFDERVNSELIYNADLCVAPGNIGLTAIHTMMFGTPCITHDSFEHQMPEFEAIKDGITGSFFKRNDSLSLANAIEKWITEKRNNRESIRTNCYAEIDNNWNPNYQMKVIKENLKF